MYFALVIFGDHIKTMKPRVLRGGDVLPECSFAYGNVFIRIKSKQTFIFYFFFFLYNEHSTGHVFRAHLSRLRGINKKFYCIGVP